MAESLNRPPSTDTSTPLINWLKAEGVKNIPEKIKVHFDFGPHGTKPDAQRARERIQKSDVILIEGSFSEAGKALLMQVARNTISFKAAAERMGARPFMYELLRLMKKGKVFIHPLDIPVTHPTEREMETVRYLLDTPEATLFRVPPLSFEEARNELERQMRYVAHHAHVVREEYSTKEFRELVKKALIEIPDLQKKKELNITVIYGTAHTALARRVGRAHGDVQVSQSIAPMPYRFSYETEFIRRISWGVAVPDKVKDDTLFEAMVHTLLKDVTDLLPTFRERTVYRRAVADALSRDEWRSIYDALSTSDIANAATALKEKLKNAEVPIGDDPDVLKKWCASRIAYQFGRPSPRK